MVMGHEAIASLDGIVIHDNWKDGRGSGGPNKNSITVDGVDVSMPEEFPFHPGNYSFKFNGPGARFELNVGYNGDIIIGLKGPFRAGFYPDDRIFLEETMADLDLNETAEGDRLYRNKISNVFTGDATEHDLIVPNTTLLYLIVVVTATRT